MAFQSGVATSITDLWAKLKTFATGTLGWTEHGTAGTNPVGSVLSSPAGAYYGIGYNGIGAIDVINLCLTSGFTADAAFSAQSGTSWLDPCQTTIGPIVFPTTAYWFFGEAEYFYFVIEDVPGQFWHGGIGTLNKTYSFSGGRFACGTLDHYSSNTTSLLNSSFYRGHQPLDSLRNYPFAVPTAQNQRRCNAMHINGASGCMGNISWSSTYAWGSHLRNSTSAYPIEYSRANNDYVGRTILHPAWVIAKGTWGGTAFNGLIGVAPNFANVNLKYIGGKSVLALGSDDWYLFPIRKFNTSMADVDPSELSTGLLGMAYKRVD